MCNHWLLAYFSLHDVAMASFAPYNRHVKDPTVWVLGTRSEQDSASLAPEPPAFLLVVIAKPASGQVNVESTSLADHGLVGYTDGKGFSKT